MELIARKGLAKTETTSKGEVEHGENKQDRADAYHSDPKESLFLILGEGRMGLRRIKEDKTIGGYCFVKKKVGPPFSKTA